MDYFAAVMASRISRKGNIKQRESLFLPSTRILRYITAEEDIRIASRPVKKTDPGESSAADFYNQQNIGNIQTALQLGSCLARFYCSYCSNMKQQRDEMFRPIWGRLAILYSYAVNRVIQTLPNSLIAQTVLSTFYNMVKQENTELYQEIRDPIPFSLYILRDKRVVPTESYGEIFVSLYNRQSENELSDFSDEDLAAFVDKEYENFYQSCMELMKGFSFQNV